MHTPDEVSLQAAIDCNIFPSLVEVLNSDADYKTRKEAAWAVLNATSGGTQEQIRQVASIRHNVKGWGDINMSCARL
jgi:hypothetical protein